MNRPSLRLALTALLAAISLSACGRALTVPEGLEIRDYKANEAFTMTFVMKTCSDTCQSYDPATCEIAFDSGTMRASIAVPFGPKADADPETLKNCSLRCGPPVLAHCAVGALSAGTYSVVAETFESTIVVH